MKIFLKRRISFLLILILCLAALQLLLVFLSLDHTRSFATIRHEVLMILTIFLLIQLSLTVLIIAQIPYYLKRYFTTIEDIVAELSRGSYNLDIDIEEHKKYRDKEYVDLIASIKKMIAIILRFDSLKKEKVQEHKARIVALLNLTENGFIIVNKKGDIVFINHLIARYFPTITEGINILETSFNFEIDNNIKSYISAIVKNKEKLVPKNYYMSIIKHHINLKSEIIRDNNGDFDGTVIGIFNLEKNQNINNSITEKNGN